KDGHNDFRLHQRRSRKIARIRGDILHDDHLPAGGRCTTESGIEGNARVGRKAAGERSDDQVAGVRGIDQIKTRPVVARHLFVQTLGHTLHKGIDRGSAPGKVLKFLEKFSMHTRHDSAYTSRVSKVYWRASFLPNQH